MKMFTTIRLLRDGRLVGERKLSSAAAGCNKEAILEIASFVADMMEEGRGGASFLVIHGNDIERKP